MNQTSDERFESRTSARCRAGVVGALLIGFALLGGVAGSAQAAGYKVDVGSLANQDGGDPSECPVDTSASTRFPAVDSALDCGEEGGCGAPGSCGGGCADVHSCPPAENCGDVHVDSSTPWLMEPWGDPNDPSEALDPLEPEAGVDRSQCVGVTEGKCSLGAASIVQTEEGGDVVEATAVPHADCAADGKVVNKIYAFINYRYDEGKSSAWDFWTFWVKVNCPQDSLDRSTLKDFKDTPNYHNAGGGDMGVTWSAEEFTQIVTTCDTEVGAKLERKNCRFCEKYFVDDDFDVGKVDILVIL